MSSRPSELGHTPLRGKVRQSQSIRESHDAAERLVEQWVKKPFRRLPYQCPRGGSRSISSASRYAHNFSEGVFNSVVRIWRTPTAPPPEFARIPHYGNPSAADPPS